MTAVPEQVTPVQVQGLVPLLQSASASWFTPRAMEAKCRSASPAEARGKGCAAQHMGWPPNMPPS